MVQPADRLHATLVACLFFMRKIVPSFRTYLVRIKALSADRVLAM